MNLERDMEREAAICHGREHKPVLDVEAIGERDILQVRHRLPFARCWRVRTCIWVRVCTCDGVGE